MSNKNDKIEEISLRLFFSIITIATVFLIIVIRIFYLQIYKSEYLTKKARKRYERVVAVKSNRGNIYDRNKKALSVSIEGKTIAARPKKIKNKEATAKLLSKALNIDENKILEKLNRKANFVFIARNMLPQKGIRYLEKIKKKNELLIGIEITSIDKSIYPNEKLAAQVIGFTGIDKIGLEGIEAKYNKELEKSKKKYLIKKGRKGKVVYSEKDIYKNYDGTDIVLTIDREIQYIAEKELKKTVDINKAKSGMALVMDNKTGEILAMANYPTFNPNHFTTSGNPNVWRNRTITDIFEPGSTLKIFIAATALELGYYTKDSLLDCENGKFLIENIEINDVRPHKWLSLEQIIRVSSNIGIVKVANTIRKKNMYKFLSDFGLGKKTGIELSGETIGKLRNYKNWTEFDIASISYGQGIGVSAIQLLCAASAIANGGTLMKPHIIKSLIHKNPYKIEHTKPKAIKKVISAETSKIVIGMMDKVVNKNGTGRRAKSNTYRLCGKTGTAQKADGKGGMSNDKYVASFLGFAPVENPKLTILVIVDEPEVSHQGGEVAAPVFKKIAVRTLNYMHNQKFKKIAGL